MSGPTGPEPALPQDDSPSPVPLVERLARARWQLGMRTVILLTAAIAGWLAFAVNRRHNATLESRIRSMRPLAHVLEVDDPTKIAVVKLDELWMDDDQWDLHLPAGAYRLCMATRAVGQDGFAPVVKSAPLDAGRRRLALGRSKDAAAHHVVILSDGRPLLTLDEPLEWDPGEVSEGGGDFSQGAQRPADQPLVMYRRRFLRRRTSTGPSPSPLGPTNGLMLWIEPMPGSGGGPSR